MLTRRTHHISPVANVPDHHVIAALMVNTRSCNDQNGPINSPHTKVELKMKESTYSCYYINSAFFGAQA